ncbi:maturase K [Anopheles sinensis]|uniref:Maturase K n=1 Tax=Anopheles sinensis TaxID=74873 RepID=A0A084WNW5_ANOSI|nr:maturase K [Anopheles sinensis]
MLVHSTQQSCLCPDGYHYHLWIRRAPNTPSSVSFTLGLWHRVEDLRITFMSDASVSSQLAARLPPELASSLLVRALARDRSVPAAGRLEAVWKVHIKRLIYCLSFRILFVIVLYFAPFFLLLEVRIVREFRSGRLSPEEDAPEHIPPTQSGADLYVPQVCN